MTDRAADEGGGDALQRVPLRRADDDAGRPEGAGVQRPPGRSGDAGAACTAWNAISAHVLMGPPRGN